MNDPKVFKLRIGNDLVLSYPKIMWFWGWKVKVTGSVSAFFTLVTIIPMLLHIWLTTAIWCGFELLRVPSSFACVSMNTYGISLSGSLLLSWLINLVLYKRVNICELLKVVGKECAVSVYVQEPHVNTCYKHFYYFVTEFNLVGKKELEPLVSCHKMHC